MGKQVTELDTLPSFTDTGLLPVHNGAGLKKGSLSQLADYIGTKFSNPNLLINPDFKINQRGQTEYAYEAYGLTKYTVDRFRAYNLNVKIASDGLILNVKGTDADGGYLSQVLEDAVKGNTILSLKVSEVVGSIRINNSDSENSGGALTVSSSGIYTVKGNNTKKVIIRIAKGSSCKIEWIKLEQGSIATPFVAPNPAEELAKCQRYGISIALEAGTIGFIGSVIMRFPLLLPVKMRANPTITVKEKTCAFVLSNQGKQQKKAINTPTIILNNNFICINQSGEYSYDTWQVMMLDSQLNYFLDAEIY